MSEIIIRSTELIAGPTSLPEPRIRIAVRVATMDDLPFVDALQKKHSKQLGFFPRAQMEGYIKNQWMLIAEQNGSAIGYVASRDRYLKRDELGVIYQLCVEPGLQRKLIGAALVKAVFERSAYGCRLYCCWCAQDLAANYFWESLGFVPVAFRAGSSGKKRVHIFWQKRIVENDVETKWWYPSQTNQGAIREDRLVFPIPPGTHWKEVQAVVVPDRNVGILPAIKKGSEERKKTLRAGGTPTVRNAAARGGFRMGPIVQTTAERGNRSVEKPKREKIKNDPKYIAAARELRDRWLEHVNEQELLPAGKYQVARLLPEKNAVAIEPKQIAIAA